MPNDAVVTEPKVEVKEENKEKTLAQEVREKSFPQLLKEQQTARQKPDSQENKAPTHSEEETKKAEEERLAKEAAEAKSQVEADEKRQADLATKAAEEVIAKQKAEEQAKLDKIRQEEEAKKRQEDLKPKFTGKDKDGNTVPLSYEELTAESVRIAKEEAKAELLAELEAKEEAKREEARKVEQTDAQRKQAQKTYEDQLQKELDTDLRDIYTAGDLPRIKDINDENDIGNKEFKNLFETAQRVNADLVAKGLPPIRSIKLIRYAKDEKGQPYYKPLAQPAGHNAPILGSESPLSHEAPDDQYVPARDRHKSMGQLIKEERARIAKRLNIRGN